MGDLLDRCFMHLVFRYIGFWWLFLTLVRPTPAGRSLPAGFVATSALYWGHIAYSWVWTHAEGARFVASKRYARGCAEVAGLCGAAVALECFS